LLANPEIDLLSLDPAASPLDLRIFVLRFGKGLK